MPPYILLTAILRTGGEKIFCPCSAYRMVHFILCKKVWMVFPHNKVFPSIFLKRTDFTPNLTIFSKTFHL